MTIASTTGSSTSAAFAGQLQQAISAGDGRQSRHQHDRDDGRPTRTPGNAASEAPDSALSGTVA
jgi:hypothetical protein